MHTHYSFAFTASPLDMRKFRNPPPKRKHYPNPNPNCVKPLTLTVIFAFSASLRFVVWAANGVVAVPAAYMVRVRVGVNVMLKGKGPG